MDEVIYCPAEKAVLLASLSAQVSLSYTNLDFFCKIIQLELCDFLRPSLVTMTQPCTSQATLPMKTFCHKRSWLSTPLIGRNGKKRCQFKSWSISFVSKLRWNGDFPDHLFPRRASAAFYHRRSHPRILENSWEPRNVWDRLFSGEKCSRNGRLRWSWPLWNQRVRKDKQVEANNHFSLVRNQKNQPHKG